MAAVSVISKHNFCGGTTVLASSSCSRSWNSKSSSERADRLMEHRPMRASGVAGAASHRSASRTTQRSIMPQTL